MVGRIAAIVAALMVSLMLSGPGAAAERIALVIGNANYAPIGRLANPVNDVDLIARALRAAEFDVTVLPDLGKTDMETAILEFGRRLRGAGPETDALFYFAGHGIQSKGRNFLIPVDATLDDEADLVVRAVQLGWVLEQMDSARTMADGSTPARTGVNIVILDACRDNPLTRSFRKVVNGLAEARAPSGTILAYSTAPGELAYDGDGKYSPYAEALARQMAVPGQAIEDVLKNTRIDVMERTARRQVPWEDSSLVGWFYFHPDGALPAAPDPEFAAWMRALDSASVENIRIYLDLYPEGRFRAQAENLLQAYETRPEDGTTSVAPETGGAAGKTADGGADVAAASEASEEALRLGRQERRELQRRLTLLGFDTQGVDGLFGANSRSAIRAWQSANSMDATGFLDGGQVETLEQQSASQYARWRAAEVRAAERRRAERKASEKPADSSAGAADPPELPPVAREKCETFDGQRFCEPIR